MPPYSKNLLKKKQRKLYTRGGTRPKPSEAERKAKAENKEKPKNM